MAQFDSRLVFVQVKGAQSRRKVAFQISPNDTWDSFLEDVKQKLRVQGIQHLEHQQTGEIVTSLSEIGDVEDLILYEALEPRPAGKATGKSDPNLVNSEIQQIGAQSSIVNQRQQSAERPVGYRSVEVGHQGDDSKARRVGLLRRYLQRLMPDMFSPSLPVAHSHGDNGDSSKSVKGVRRRRRTPTFSRQKKVMVFITLLSVTIIIIVYQFMLKSL